MKRILIALTLTFSVVIGHAQTANEIIEKYIETIGGKAKIREISSIRMRATVDYGGTSIPLDMVSQQDGKMYVKINFQGKEITQVAFDGETMWSTNFMTMKAEKSDAETTENMKREKGEFFSPLIDYAVNGFSIERLDDETIEGTNCFKLKLTKRAMLVEKTETPNVEYYYIDKDNYVPIVVEAEIPSGEMKGQISQVIYSDYQEVNGVYFPFSMKQGIKGMGGQTMLFTNITFNEIVDASLFKFPE